MKRLKSQSKVQTNIVIKQIVLFIIGFMKRLLHKILCTISTIDEINRLYSEADRNRSQIMPGRTFKRKKNKAKGRTHFNNQKVSF